MNFFRAPPRELSLSTIDALDEHIAVIDCTGRIVSVNQAWREFARRNGGDPARLCEGAHYLNVCDQAASRNNNDATLAGTLIRAVIAGERDTAVMEYPCHSPTEMRWYRMRVSKLSAQGQTRVVIEHENVSARKIAEDQVRLQNNLLASVEQAVVATDVSGNVTYWNPHACLLYGWSAEEAIGKPLRELVPAKPLTASAAPLPVRAAGESWTGEYLATRRDGTAFPVQVTGSPLRDDGQQLIGDIRVSSDITERKKIEQALKLSDMVYQAIGEAILVMDAAHRIVTINPAFSQLTGYAEDELVGQPLSLLKEGTNEPLFGEDMEHQLEETGHCSGAWRSRRKDGQFAQDWLQIDTIYDPRRQVRLRIGMFSRVTDQKQAKQTIWQQANFDVVTGLPNRSRFRDRLRHEIQKAARAGDRLALMFIDLDQFKEVNDTLGHDAGDILLRQAADRISACVRGVDAVARLGGDEFTVIMTALRDGAAIERVARKILRTLSTPFRIEDTTLHISASIGITLFPQDAINADALVKNADQAMYAAKERGRNQFNYFLPRMQQEAQASMRMGNDLRHALAGNQLELLYQPIIALGTGQVTKAEALLRWRHPRQGMIHPETFIPIAERTGLIVPIGEWVWQQAQRQAAHWRRDLHPDFQVSVNMSPAQVRNPDAARAPWNGFTPPLPTVVGPLHNEIVVEITEGLLLEASDTVSRRMQLFHDAGIQLSIDDFGTGYSALSYLKRFHIDYLKIDKVFVRTMTANSHDLALCEGIIMLGHKLGIQVVAEGVETDEQRKLLTSAGCDFAQGFLFAAPLLPKQLEQRLRRAPHEGATAATRH